ncbi:MAG TPA: gamma-glutamyltransferase family protein [Tepidisphaeraceae bacterium]|jgi:gamma-glutamyltranspeptidase/glutathione hydrolase|nr:gamma-glutamyltransferase family protein [Tepidisphaeraceae bacterium]
MPDTFWNQPYPSARSCVLAKNIVATSQPLAAQAGLAILRAGGNAVDAAVATAAVMAIVEPGSNGLGADNFAMVWHEGKLYGLNASGRSPKAATIDSLGNKRAMPTMGWPAVTVPGAVSGWVALSKRFGKLPLAKVMEAAIHYAKDGFPVAPLTASRWAGAKSHYRQYPDFLKVFVPNGHTPAAGEIFRNPDAARSLQLIADSSGEAYYRGELARQFVAHSSAAGGLFTADDLASHTADWVDPISIDYHGTRIYELPPNGQGLAALQALAILQHRDVRHLEADCPDVQHLGIEAMKLAFADAHQYIADPKFMTMKAEQLLDAKYIAQRAALVDPDRAGDPKAGTPKDGGTILLAAADQAGTMVTLIQSNYQGFGSGIVIPNTGIHLQNRGACFVLTPGHSNQFAGGKRPYHTIIPAFATRQSDKGTEQPLMAFGVMGGFMQPQGHLQVAARIIDFHQNPQAALDAPRWQVTTAKHITIEPGFPQSVYDDLTRRGHEITRATTRNIAFGSGQIILRMGDCYAAGSDPRHDGQAVGY